MFVLPKYMTLNMSSKDAILKNLPGVNVSFTGENKIGSSFQTIPLKRKKWCCLSRRRKFLTKEQYEEKIARIQKLCLTRPPEGQENNWKMKGLTLLDDFVNRITLDNFEISWVMTLVWCSVNCVHYFHMQVHSSTSLKEWGKRRIASKAMETYEKLLNLLLPYLSKIVIAAIITFYTEAKLWEMEFLCADVLKKLLNSKTRSSQTFNAMLDVAEKTSTHNIKDARQIVRVLYDILKNYHWIEMDVELITRILTMFYKSIMPSKSHEYNYAPLRFGLEVCIRRILENMTNEDLVVVIKIMLQWTFDEMVSDDALLDFGSVLEYAALLHNTRLYRDSLSDLLPLILRLVASSNRFHSLLGNRVFQHLIDRHSNRMQFDTPRIFFADTHFNVTIGEYHSEDRAFIRKCREMIHATLLVSVIQHGMNRVNLESTYTSIALLVVEVPCGYTAAAIVCLAMSIQDSTIEDETIPLECSHRLHATVMAIMSLVCWVHKAEAFYNYLNSVMGRRAQFAPHLNPPLKPSYQYADHHVLWNKPELFFEDWEVRYGLWKCFRTRKSKTFSTSS